MAGNKFSFAFAECVMRRIAMFLISSLATAGFATTTNYVWMDAPGKPRDGSDWLHAYTEINPALQSRDTVTFIAPSLTGASYAPFQFKARENGRTNWLFRATTNEHGTPIGWDPRLGAAANQVVVYGQNSIGTSRLIVDGKFRDESIPGFSWSNILSYGIWFRCDNPAAHIVDLNPDAGYGSTQDHIRFEHCAIGGTNGAGPAGTAPAACFYQGIIGQRTDLQLIRCYIGNAINGALTRNGSSNILMYSWCGPSYDKEFWSFQAAPGFSCNDWLIASNVVCDTGASPVTGGAQTCAFGGFSLSPPAEHIQRTRIIYNAFVNTGKITVGYADGIVELGDLNHSPAMYASNCIVANNTYCDIPGQNGFIAQVPSANTVSNNVQHSTIASAIGAIFNPPPQ